ncbi:MAG: thioredoxin family protein [Odoribacteraceae bacterium]|jgi:thiol-disulfide isomerase/thioredoxin|nr:thioredoxin family protein [Odoribacteraceae bacterium]
MRHLLILLLLPALAAGQGVNFQALPLDSALAEATRQGKHLFIDGYTSWCGPCKLMDSEVFPLKEIGDYFNPRFISVKYDMERHPDGRALAARFGIRAYPTFIILDGNNEMLHLFAGGTLDLTFIDKVDAAFDDTRALGILARRLAAGDTSVATRARHLQALQHAYTRDITGLADTLWDNLDDAGRLHPACLFLLDDLAPDGSPRARYLLDTRDELRAASGRAAVDPRLEKKYIERYTRLLRGQRSPSRDRLDATRAEIDALQLPTPTVLPLYEQALLLKSGDIAPDALVTSIETAAPALAPLSLDLYLYALLSNATAELGADRARALLPLVSSDRTRDYISKAARLQ